MNADKTSIGLQDGGVFCGERELAGTQGGVMGQEC